LTKSDKNPNPLTKSLILFKTSIQQAFFIDADHLPQDSDFYKLRAKRFENDPKGDNVISRAFNLKKKNIRDFHFTDIEAQIRKEDMKMNAQTSNVFPKPGLLPMGNDQDNLSELQRAYSFIFKSVKKYQTNLVIYPQPIVYTDTTPDDGSGIPKTYNYTDGVIMNIKPSTMSGITYFNWVKAKTDIEFDRAKALYDTNVAVLRIEGFHQGSVKDLTYESDAYCEILATWLGKYPKCLNSFEFLKYYGPNSKTPTAQLVFLNESDIARDSLLMIPGDKKLGVKDSQVPQVRTFF